MACPITKGDRKKISRNGEYEKRWTFITNHAAVLSLLANHPRITAWEISQEVGITERSVRIIISDLDKGGYISKIREGRGVRYLVDFERPMRHKTQRDVAVKHLMSILSSKCSSIKKRPYHLIFTLEKPSDLCMKRWRVEFSR